MIIEAKDFAGATTAGYQFGAGSSDKIVEGLLKLVAAIADGRALVQGVNVKAEMTVDDYLLHDFTIRFAERPDPLPDEVRVRVTAAGLPEPQALDELRKRTREAVAKFYPDQALGAAALAMREK
jgi:hypothetical protein